MTPALWAEPTAGKSFGATVGANAVLIQAADFN